MYLVVGYFFCYCDFAIFFFYNFWKTKLCFHCSAWTLAIFEEVSEPNLQHRRMCLVKMSVHFHCPLHILKLFDIFFTFCNLISLSIFWKQICVFSAIFEEVTEPNLQQRMCLVKMSLHFHCVWAFFVMVFLTKFTIGWLIIIDYLKP